MRFVGQVFAGVVALWLIRLGKEPGVEWWVDLTFCIVGLAVASLCGHFASGKTERGAEKERA